MSNNYIEIYQGDISDIFYIRPEPLNNGDPIDVNWICKIAVENDEGIIVVANRTITEKATVSIKGVDGSTTNEECFVCYLVKTETSNLVVDDNGSHKFAIELSNSIITPEFNLEMHIEMKVKKQIVV